MGVAGLETPACNSSVSSNHNSGLPQSGNNPPDAGAVECAVNHADFDESPRSQHRQTIAEVMALPGLTDAEKAEAVRRLLNR